MKITDLEDGLNEIKLAVSNIEEKETKTRKFYSVVTLMDGEQSIEAKMWTEKDLLRFMPGDVINCRIEKQYYQGNVSYILGKDYEVTEDDFEDYLPKAPIDALDVYGDMLSTVNHFTNEKLKKIVLSILKDEKENFLKAPAAKKVHHNYVAGLAFHEGRMLELAKKIVEVYPNIDEDLLYAGTIMHDIGKVYELEQNYAGAIEYTVVGNLLGHMIIAIQLIERKAIALGIDPDDEIIMLLKHMIASHHGEPETGAITRPATKEAMLLHEIDMNDSRIWQFEKAEAETDPGALSERIFGLESVVYRPTSKRLLL